MSQQEQFTLSLSTDTNSNIEEDHTVPIFDETSEKDALFEEREVYKIRFYESAYKFHPKEDLHMLQMIKPERCKKNNDFTSNCYVYKIIFDQNDNYITSHLVHGGIEKIYSGIYMKLEDGNYGYILHTFFPPRLCRMKIENKALIINPPKLFSSFEDFRNYIKLILKICKESKDFHLYFRNFQYYIRDKKLYYRENLSVMPETKIIRSEYKLIGEDTLEDDI